MAIVLLVAIRLLVKTLFPLQVSLTVATHYEYFIKVLTSYLISQLGKQALCYEMVLYMMVVLFITTGPSIMYRPRSQRNLLSKALKLVTWPLRDKVYELADRFNWALTEARLNNRWLLSFHAVVHETVNDRTSKKQREGIFDTDSENIGIDNRCSACISHKAEDFVGELKHSDRSIKGFGGAITRKVMIGTLLWCWLDDQGQTHKFLIPNSYYVPHGGVRLLSPQHWAQTRKKSRPVHTHWPTGRKDFVSMPGVGEFTGAESCVLYWDQCKYQRTIPLNKHGTNVATMQLAPGYGKFQAFCAEAGLNDDQVYDASPFIVDAHEIIDDEESESDELVEMEDATTNVDTANMDAWSEEGLRQFDLAGPSEEKKKEEAPVVIIDEEDRGPRTATSELLQYHYKFGHISFEKLQKMAEQGTLPKRLAKCNVPRCSACLYAKATKRQWRQKTRRNEQRPDGPIKPGDVVSVDQMVSQTPGLIAQMTGFLTRKRYRYATVFVDQASRMGYVYLQKTASAEETIKAKHAFEKFSEMRGIAIKAYHADNGIFKANDWVMECCSRGQPLTFAGVNAHHQNGLAERRIRELQELARTMLIHANRRWPDAVTAHLWPYALRMANASYNATPSFQDESRRSPEQVFGDTKVSTNPKHWMPFGCPTYVLQDSLQTGKGIFPKWKERSRVGIYLGQSPVHNQNVALVLDVRSGYVSPQFHIKFDSSFHTAKQQTLKPAWLERTGFVSPKEKESEENKPSTKKQRKRKRGLEGGAQIAPIGPPEGAVPPIAPSEGAQLPQRKPHKHPNRMFKNAQLRMILNMWIRTHLIHHRWSKGRHLSNQRK